MTGALVRTGVKVTGKVVEKAIDAVTPTWRRSDHSTGVSLATDSASHFMPWRPKFT